tara:strand:- start:1279 stop:1770 length:492 start_codon:yes stop_codon:yes gene_type:complete
MQKYLNNKNFYILILLLSIITLVSAVYVEYVIGAQPCILCKYQRVPYVLSIFFCFFGYYNQENKIWIYLLMATFLVSFFISGYHVGIENNIFPEFSGCSADNLKVFDKDTLIKSLSEIPPNCKDVNFRIIGLSLATINVLISIIIIIISFILINYEKNRQKIN